LCFFSILSLASHLPGRLEERHLVILFSSFVELFRISEQGTYMLGSELILLLNLYRSFFKLWTYFMLLRYCMFGNCCDMESSVTILLY